MLRSTATILCAASIVTYQLGLLPFFSPLLTLDRPFWPIVYWGFLAAHLITAALIIWREKTIRIQGLPIWIGCFLAIIISLIHGLDSIEKNFIVTTAFFGWIVTLALASDPKQLLRFSASATFITAVITLCDVLFSDGFTNSVGRAAGLNINPNVAAAALLLGAGASFWVVPARFSISFLTVIGAAIFVTLSKSTMLMGILIAAVVFGLKLCIIIKQRHSFLANNRLTRAFPLVGPAILLCIVGALVSNDRFQVAVSDSYHTARVAVSAFEAAQSYIAREVAAGPHSPAQKHVAEVEQLNERVQNEGQINSISARGLLLRRGWLAYQDGPAFGVGLNAAHKLIPHNTFLLFAIAFGRLGWLIPLIFICLCAFATRQLLQLPLVLSVVAIMSFSHDIMFSPGLIIPVALGVAAQIEQSKLASWDGTKQIRWATLLALVGFTTGTLAAGTSITSTRSAVTRDITFAVDGNAYITAVSRPNFSGILRIGAVDLFEDGRNLGPRTKSEQEVIELGHGRYFQNLRDTVFSASDNSDPRTNGKSYEVSANVKWHPLGIFVFLVLSIWAGRWWFRFKPTEHSISYRERVTEQLRPPTIENQSPRF